MNVLPLVFTLLLTLSILTYTRLEKFKSFSAIRTEYNSYIKTREKEVLGEKQKNAAKHYPSVSFRQLSMSGVLRSSVAKQNPAKAEQQKNQLKELMHVLYSKADFYQRLQAKRPEFLDEILNQIVASRDLFEDKVIQCTEDLTKIRMPDPELQEAFYFMLKGTKTKEQPKAQNSREDLSVSKASLKQLEDEKHSYYSLLQFVKYNDEAVSVRLASEEVLAIFFQPQTVNQIIEQRKQLKKELNANNKALINQQFKEFCKPFLKPGVEESALDFSLSETR
jgi:hypothetical protein